MGNWCKRVGSAALICLAVVCLRAEAPDPQSWPMFRGSPGLWGVSKVQFPVTSLGPVWNFKTQGPVKSSPSIDQRRVFVGSTDGHLYALDLNSGKKLWSFKTEAAIESSPLVLNGRVFIGSTDANLYALDA